MEVVEYNKQYYGQLMVNGQQWFSTLHYTTKSYSLTQCEVGFG